MADPDEGLSRAPSCAGLCNSSIGRTLGHEHLRGNRLKFELFETRYRAGVRLNLWRPFAHSRFVLSSYVRTVVLNKVDCVGKARESLWGCQGPPGSEVAGEKVSSCPQLGRSTNLRTHVDTVLFWSRCRICSSTHCEAAIRTSSVASSIVLRRSHGGLARKSARNDGVYTKLTFPLLSPTIRNRTGLRRQVAKRLQNRAPSVRVSLSVLHITIE